MYSKSEIHVSVSLHEFDTLDHLRQEEWKEEKTESDRETDTERQIMGQDCFQGGSVVTVTLKRMSTNSGTALRTKRLNTQYTSTYYIVIPTFFYSYFQNHMIHLLCTLCTMYVCILL